MPDSGLPAVPPRIDTYSEEWRHACEVRYVAAMTLDRREEFCRGVERHRGREAAVRLWRDARELAP